jgi:RNA polymerase sigma-70 factor (ECF subfamily)
MQIAPELLRDAQAGNPAAFNHIVIAYRRKVIGTVARMIGRPEDAEDVAQEVFTRLYFNLKSLKDTGAFEIWLHRMTANAAYDHCERARRPTRTLG